MYAIVRIGGKQYQAEPGKTLVVDRLALEVGEKVELNEVLLIGGGDDTLIGTPLVSGGVVSAEVVEQFKGKKVVIWKYRAKQRYRRKAGQRAHHTRLLINSIDVPSAKKSRSKKSDAADASEE
jgi:large subunit ribosomal protein L21